MIWTRQILETLRNRADRSGLKADSPWVVIPAILACIGLGIFCLTVLIMMHR